MNRLDLLKNTKEKKTVIYMMAGDPSLAATEKLIYAAERAGASVIELGVPFSDPIADGPTIQAAGERALKKGVRLKDVLELARKARKKTAVPLVLMTYYNLIFSYGTHRFVNDAVKAGVDGAIIPDLPFDEEKDFYNYALKKDFYVIYLASPTNTRERLEKIVDKSRGFVYYIIEKGVTGARTKSSGSLSVLRKVKKRSKIPVFAGFGISTPAQAKNILKAADGVIIGSAFVSVIHKSPAGKMAGNAEKFIKSFSKGR